MTYDPSQDKMYMVWNTETHEMQINPYSGSSGERTNKRELLFHGPKPFFVDDVFYFDQYVEQELIDKIYDYSECFSIFCDFS